MFHLKSNLATANKLRKGPKSIFFKFILKAFWAYILSIVMTLVTIILIFVAIMSAIETATDESECSGNSSSSAANTSIDESIPKSEHGVAEAMWKECKRLGLNDAQAAGVCGQAHQEDPSLNVEQPNTSGDGGMGLFQITPKASGVDVKTWASQHHMNWKSPAAQVDCFYYKFFKAQGFAKKHGSVAQETYWASEAEGGGSTKADTNEGNRQSGGSIFYKEFAGKSDAGDASDTADAGDSSSSGSSKCGGSSSSGGSDDEIAFGKKYLGLDYSEHTHVAGAEDIAKGKSKSDTSPTDCSGFVWGVLKHCGYGTTSSPWTVGSGATENTYFKEHHETVSGSDTHAGSVVMANGDAHTAILMEKWHGAKTKIIQEGGAALGKDKGDGQGDCNDDQTYSYAFGSENPPSSAIFANPGK